MPENGRCEYFDHTGDVGFVVRSETVEGLFEAAVPALFGVILEPGNVNAHRSLVIRIEDAVDREDLLIRFLSELLFLHDARDWIFAGARVIRLSGTAIEAKALGEMYDPGRHPIQRQVKAVTYHDLRIEREPDGTWFARVVLDL